MVNISQEGIECYTYDQIIEGSRLIEVWLNEAVWSRAFILSTVEDLPNLPEVTNRLAQVPAQFYNIFRTYWEDRLAQQFTEYFANRIASKENLLNAMIRNDPNTADNYTRELYANADDLSAFLAQFPAWSKDDWLSMLYSSISLYLREVESILNANYNMEISIFDNIINHNIDMGNYMAYGILRRRYT